MDSPAHKCFCTFGLGLFFAPALGFLVQMKKNLDVTAWEHIMYGNIVFFHSFVDNLKKTLSKYINQRLKRNVFLQFGVKEVLKSNLQSVVFVQPTSMLGFTNVLVSEWEQTLTNSDGKPINRKV